MGQVSVSRMEVEATGREKREWEEEKRFLWGCCKADAGEVCLSFLSIKQHLPGLLATKRHIFRTYDP